MHKLAIISLSGGLDSSTLLAQALHEGYSVITIGFNYGQKNIPELTQRQKIIKYFKEKYPEKYIKDEILDVSSTLNNFTRIYEELRDSNKIKEETTHKFYTPSRNLLFAVFSAVIGEISALAMDFNEVSIGLGLHKHSEEAYGQNKDYWDITPEFAKRLQYLFELNDVKKIEIYTPFIELTKTDVVKRSLQLNVPIELTWTCYDPVYRNLVDDVVYAYPCGKCEACIEREIAGKRSGIGETINKYFAKIQGTLGDKHG